MRVLRVFGNTMLLLLLRAVMTARADVGDGRGEWRWVKMGVTAGALLGGPQQAVASALAQPLAILEAYRLTAPVIAPQQWRSVEFWGRVIPIYALYKLTQMKVSGVADEAERDKIWAKRHDWGSRKVYQLCVELRGFYLKDGQFIGSRADFIPASWAEKLSKLQDQVPPVPFAQVEKTLKEALSINSSRQLFSELNEKPLGSATIAQVHRATMRDGRDVVVKAQYSDQETLCQRDLRNLKALASFLQKTDMAFFDMVSVVEEFEVQIPHEFDFMREAAMQERIRRNLERAGICPNRLVVPSIVSNLVSRNALVMDFINGCKVSDMEMLRRWKINPKTIVETLGKAYGQMLLVDGVFHADPHSGNLLVLRDGRVGLIDFGQTKELDTVVRKRLCAFYLAMLSGDPKRIAPAFRALGIVLDMDPKAPGADEMTAVYANGLLDTAPLPPEVEIDPFSNASPLKQAPIKVFPSQLFMVLRTMGLLRALCVVLGVETAMCWHFRSYARIGLTKD